MVELVDTRDLKSLEGNFVPVQVRLWAPIKKNLIYLMETIQLDPIKDEKGQLCVIEAGKSIPFDIKRVYYIFSNLNNSPRGFHAHKKLNQAAFCISGSCHIHFNDLKEKKKVILDSPHQIVLIPPLVWHEMHEFSPDCILVVLASDVYEEDDYIRDFEEFKLFLGSQND